MDRRRWLRIGAWNCWLRQGQGDGQKCCLGRITRGAPRHSTPAEQKAWLDPVPARHRRDVCIRPRGFRNNRLLLRFAPAPPSFGDDRISARKTISRHTPRPSSVVTSHDQQELYPERTSQGGPRRMLTKDGTLTVAQIAERLKVSPSTLYKHCHGPVPRLARHCSAGEADGI